MISDRHYMRDRPSGWEQPLTIQLIFVLIACFVVENVVLYYTDFPLFKWFALTPRALQKGWLWQLLTFQFLHAPLSNNGAGFFHIFCNCLGLYFVGQAMETAISRRQYLTLYLGSGIIGGLLQALGSIFLPGNFGPGAVGASAGLAGLLAAFCFMFPGQQILLFFIIPVPAKFFFIFGVLLSIFGILVPQGANSGVAHGAHLGGMLAGYAYVRWVLNSTWELPSIRWPFRKKSVIISSTRSSAGRASIIPEGDIPLDEFMSKEVDPILDKISQHGIQSLTERERRILEAARARTAKR
jgi:membrane associated rhomboid family serine protease